MKKLFVGSLSWDTTDDSLRDFFATAGNVVTANVVKDRDTGRSRGFGFVEMSTEEEAQKAIQELNGKELDGRTISVNEAKPQEPRTGGGGGFNRGGGSGFGRDSRGGSGGGFNRDRRSGGR